MSELTFDDLLVLSKANVQQQVLVVTSALEESSMPRLISAGLATQHGKLTKKGVQAAEKVMKRFQEMHAGIPLERRIRLEGGDAEKHDSSNTGWFSGNFKQRPYCTNCELLLLGRATKTMRAITGKPATRQAIANSLTSHSSGKPGEFLELFPELFILDPSSNLRCIKLVSRDKEKVAYIQAKYYDFILAKYPSATFHLNVKKPEYTTPLQIRVTNRGWKNNTVGLIMTVVFTDATP